MPPRTNTDRLDELSQIVARLTVQIDAVERGVDRSDDAANALRDSLHAALTRLAVVEQTVADLKGSSSEWGRRGWQAFFLVLSAALGALATYLLKR